jgi:hypothetical protein
LIENTHGFTSISRKSKKYQRENAMKDIMSLSPKCVIERVMHKENFSGIINWEKIKINLQHDRELNKLCFNRYLFYHVINRCSKMKELLYFKSIHISIWFHDLLQLVNESTNNNQSLHINISDYHKRLRFIVNHDSKSCVLL